MELWGDCVPKGQESTAPLMVSGLLERIKEIRALFLPSCSLPTPPCYVPEEDPQQEADMLTTLS